MSDPTSRNKVTKFRTVRETMLDHDTLLARVRKLLAKAEDPAVTEAEAESYNTKAAELIARYGIDRAMLAAKDTGTDEITTVEISMDNPYSRDKASLLTNIAHPLRCRALLHRGDRLRLPLGSRARRTAVHKSAPSSHNSADTSPAGEFVQR